MDARRLKLPFLAMLLAISACDGGVTPRGDADGGIDGEDDAGEPAIDASDVDPADAGMPGDAGQPALDGGPPPPPPCPRVVVTTPAGDTLNVRRSASTAEAPIGTLASGFVAEVIGMANGESIDGVDLWYQIVSPSGEGYVFSGFVMCTDAPATPIEEGFRLPLACGTSARVSQGNGGSTSHTGRTQYAFDFAIGLNTPVHAIASGMVLLVKNDTRPGHRCYNGGGSDCGVHANYVVLLHADGNTSAYKHLNETRVTVGATVTQGQLVGLSGSTGYSTGPHLHMERQMNCGMIYCQTIPLSFVDVPGGVPATGSTVTSGNCP